MRFAKSPTATQRKTIAESFTTELAGSQVTATRARLWGGIWALFAVEEASVWRRS